MQGGSWNSPVRRVEFFSRLERLDDAIQAQRLRIDAASRRDWKTDVGEALLGNMIALRETYLAVLELQQTSIRLRARFVPLHVVARPADANPAWQVPSRSLVRRQQD